MMRPHSWSDRIFLALTRLYPSDFRARFGEEMLQVHRDQLAGAGQAGRLGVARHWLRVVPGLVWAGFQEHREANRPLFAEGGAPRLETVGQDVRLAIRMLWKTPLFTVIAVACIAVGSGAVTTIFSGANALVFRPLSGTSDAGRLVRIERKEKGGNEGASLSYPWYTTIRDQTRTLGGVVAWGKAALVLRGGSAPGDVVYGSLVSGNLFEVLGVRPYLGRFFAPDEDRTELTDPVIVVSENYWRTRLGADRGAVGRRILVNGQSFTLIGVAPREFRGMDEPIVSDAWVPLHMLPAIRSLASRLDDPGSAWLRMAGRLKPGISPAAAEAELTGFAETLVQQSNEPEWARKYQTLRISPLTGLPPDATGPLGQFLALLLGAAVLVLIIASVNVAGMLSARAVHRRREMAVRAALGGTPGRLTRQLLTEILLLFGLGAMGGVLFAWAATSALERLPLTNEVPVQLTLTPDPRAMAFALLVSLVTGLIVGLSPTRQAVRPDLGARLRDGFGGIIEQRGITGRALVAGQIATSLVLLVGASLLGRALLHASRADPGFTVAGVVTVPLDVESWGYDEARGRRFFNELDARLATLPGITARSYTTTLPLNFQSSGTSIELPDNGASARVGVIGIHQILIGPEYFDALRIPLVGGRGVSREDTEQSGRVAVVNETMARQFWPGKSALGQTFRQDGKPVTVVGIARDARYASLTETTPSLAYFPLTQAWRARRNLIVRTDAGIAAIAPALQQTIQAVDAGAPRVMVSTLAEASGVAFLPARVATLVTGVLGLAGLLLSVTGLYGVISYSAARRTKEIGIRLALGAEQRQVLRLILKEGMGITAVGLLVGLPLSGLAAPLLSSLLLGMRPLEPLVFLLAPLMLAGVALLASFVPARRAARLAPWVVLRED